MNIRKLLIVATLIAVFMISIVCGFMIKSYISFSKKENQNTAILAENNVQNESVKTNFSEVTVSPNSQITITQKYKKCGHTISKKETVPREIVNLTEEKVKLYYDGWDINKFSSDEINISRETAGICDEHYILRESDGYISISSKNNIGEYIFKGLTHIPVQYLPEEDMQNLDKGIEIVGRDNLNKFLEDFE